MAAPFVQGQLRNEALSITIRTECGHCARAMRITVDSQLRYRVDDGGAEPLIFEPHVDWETFDEPNIIHAF